MKLAIHDRPGSYSDRWIERCKELGIDHVVVDCHRTDIMETLQSVDGYCRIVDLVPGGPAMRSGLLGPGDRIVAVAQDGEDPIDVVEMPLSRIVQLIRGPKGSVVSLAVLPASAGEADDGLDCDDAIAAANPNGTEVPGNTVDEDCSGVIRED